MSEVKNYGDVSENVSLMCYLGYHPECDWGEELECVCTCHDGKEPGLEPVEDWDSFGQ